LQGITTIADYFVICSGESTPQVKAIEEHIEAKLQEESVGLLRVEGMRYCHWILMDYGDVIIHIFEEEMRAFYELEKLWIDAKKIELD
jgi:ribosome-associated protein